MSGMTPEQVALWHCNRKRRPLAYDLVGDCWIWRGWLTHDGYGPHRVVYSRLVGPIPNGLELDHLCNIPACVNPAHLEPVTGEENIRRQVMRRTCCVNGHEYTAANTRITARGTRNCRTCDRERAREYQRRQFERSAQ